MQCVGLHEGGSGFAFGVPANLIVRGIDLFIELPLNAFQGLQYTVAEENQDRTNGQ